MIAAGSQHAGEQGEIMWPTANSFLTRTWPAAMVGTGQADSTVSASAEPVSWTTAAFIVDGSEDIMRTREAAARTAGRPIMRMETDAMVRMRGGRVEVDGSGRKRKACLKA